MAKLSTRQERYEKLMQNPLLFLHLVNSPIDGNPSWVALDNEIYGSIPANHLQGNELNYTLVVAETSQTIPTETNQNIDFQVHAVTASNLNDWRIVINNFIIRSTTKNDIEDKFSYMHLLWMLNYCNWNIRDLINALRLYDVTSIKHIIEVGLCSICRCLSDTKQRYIRDIARQFGYQYALYSPPIFADAIQSLNPNLKNISVNWNLFQLVDRISQEHAEQLLSFIVESTHFHATNNDTNNLLLCFYQWMSDEKETIDYTTLPSIYALVSNDTQLKIVKRYFHDIHIGRTKFDAQIVLQFRDNPYVDFIRYRYCLETPEKPIDLTAPLLCDCLLTLYQSRGQEFQSFEGILDFAMQRCDVTKPTISFCMEKFLPLCHGGAVYNPEFQGFIDYAIIFELDESQFTETNLIMSIRQWLDCIGRHHTYLSCKYDAQKQPLTEDSKCINILYNNVENENERKSTCVTEYTYPNKWIVPKNKEYQAVVKPSVLQDVQNGDAIIIDINQTSTEVMANYIRSFAAQFTQVGENKFILSSHDIENNWQYNIFSLYFKPLISRYIPQSTSIIGMTFDVFGIRKSLCSERNDSIGCNFPCHHQGDNTACDDIKKEFKKKEEIVVKQKVINTLKQELGEDTFDGTYFEIPYENKRHHEILGLYYYKNIKDKHHNFLKKQPRAARNRFFCAPKLARTPNGTPVTNKAIELPFFWCRTVECFQNNLSHQTLRKDLPWNEYSLYHLIEILGYQKLKKTIAGWEPDSIVTGFVACANQVMKIFQRLKCRDCGHLLYPTERGRHNRYNYYSCINPHCLQHFNEIYITYCHQCKKGIIDSRETVQCPNRWYICPSCLSCCNDAQFERLAQRYILEQRSIPQHISSKLQQGHNDKNQYFCPKCGQELTFTDEHYICPTCNIKYQKFVY